GALDGARVWAPDPSPSREAAGRSPHSPGTESHRERECASTDENAAGRDAQARDPSDFLSADSLNVKPAEAHGAWRPQFVAGSSGYVDNIRRSLSWRRRTSRHRFSGDPCRRSPSVASSTSHEPSSISDSSWPSPQPAYPA